MARLSTGILWYSLVLSVCLAGCAAPVRLQPSPIASPAQPIDRTAAIERYLSGRDLDPIEGIWVWADNSYEVAIVRNTLGTATGYQYVGLLTDTERSNWRCGEVKLLLKGTASPGIFSGTYFMGNRSKHGTTFFLTNPNLIQLYLPSGPYGSQEDVFLIRVYPKSQAANAQPSQGESSAGSGFFVSSDVVATNYHIVAGAKTITLRLAGTQLQAEILLQDPQNDLALLKASLGADPLTADTLNLTVTGSHNGCQEAILIPGHLEMSTFLMRNFCRIRVGDKFTRNSGSV